MKIKNILFPNNEYFQEKCPKTQIVLHHTVSAKGEFVDDWWKSDKGASKVATAFVLDKDGTIFQLFDENYWAYHIGQGASVHDNQKTIGIEIVNEGALQIDKSTNRMTWFNGKNPYTGEYITLAKPWRGSQFFPTYTPEQYASLNELLPHLCGKFNIPKKIITTWQYSNNYRNFIGIVSHHNLRTDKSDVSKAFDFSKLRDFNLVNSIF